jgi:hypothetical protein
MALRFRILSARQAGQSGQVIVRAAYFDSTEPAVILGRSVLRLPADITRVAARDAVVAEGQRLRDAIVAENRLAEDVGTEGAVT